MSNIARTVLMVVVLMAGCVLSSAQVELHSETVSLDLTEIYERGSKEDETTVEYLLQTVKDDFCVIADVYHDARVKGDPVYVCVFEDPATSEPILYMTAAAKRVFVILGDIVFITFHEGERVHAAYYGGSILTNLAHGDWEVHVLYNGSLKATVTFTIVDDEEDE